MVTFRWERVNPGKTNGKITGYYYRLVHGDDSNIVKDGFLQGEDSTTVTLNILDHCRHCYKFSVAAENSAGIGPESDIEAGILSAESKLKPVSVES